MYNSETDKVLDIIHDQAIKLGTFDLPVEAHQIVDLIIALARYKVDIRGNDLLQKDHTDE